MLAFGVVLQLHTHARLFYEDFGRRTLCNYSECSNPNIEMVVKLKLAEMAKGHGSGRPRHLSL